MFDVGFTEVLLIAAVALMVVGPEKLPKLARTAGFWMGRARRMVADVKSDIDREIKRAELAEDMKDIKKSVDTVKSDITSATSAVGNTIRSSVDDIKSDVDSAKRDLELDGDQSNAAAASNAANPQTPAATPKSTTPTPDSSAVSGAKD